MADYTDNPGSPAQSGRPARLHDRADQTDGSVKMATLSSVSPAPIATNAPSSQDDKWFNGSEALVLKLEAHPSVGAVTPEKSSLLQLLYDSNPYAFRIIYANDEPVGIIRALHIRHGPRQNITPASP